jgi:hypothetical protein
VAVDLYRQRARALEVEAMSEKGHILEYWVYKVFDTRLMASLALTLDPFWQFDPDLRKNLQKKVPFQAMQIPVPVNRTRRALVKMKQELYCHRYGTSTTDGTYRKWIGADPWYVSAPLPHVNNGTTNYDAWIGTQYSFQSFVKDTTWKSRNPKADRIPKSKKLQRSLGLEGQGEFELYKPEFTSPNSSITWAGSTTTYNDLQDPLTWSYTPSKDSSSFRGGSASVDAGLVTALSGSERALALQTMAKYSHSLVGQCLPNRRKYNLFYQIGELKDLPQTLRGTLAIWRDIEHIIGYTGFAKAMKSPQFWTHDVYSQLYAKLHSVGVIIRPDKLSDAYLTFKFGWESMVQAVQQLAKSPGAISKDVNTLINANGSFVTLSSGMTLPEEQWTSPPTITTYVPTGCLSDPNSPPSQTGTRLVRLRCVVNSGVRLPPLDIPKLRQRLMLEKLGLTPRPSDIWNLIPWTWLVDWFQGVSSYLRLVEEIQLDETLINWGLITYISVLNTSATRNCYNTTVEAKHWSSGVHAVANKKFTTTTSGTFRATYHLRVDVSSLAKVKTTSGKGLSTTQKTILGALLAKFTQ